MHINVSNVIILIIILLYIHYFKLKKISQKKKEIMNRTKTNNYLTDSIDTELIDLWSKLDHQPKVIVCKYSTKIYKYYYFLYIYNSQFNS